MSGLFYPYKDAQDALAHLAPYADGTVGRGCGISFTDGAHISVLRRPFGSHLWLTVWRRHVAAPRALPSRRQDPSKLQRIEHFFEHAMELYGQSKLQEAQANLAMAHAVSGFVDRNMWQPTHAFLLRHRLWADAIGVAADVVGVVAGLTVLIVAGPELALGAAIVAGAATGGSLLLAAIDGTVLGAELAGNDDLVKYIDENDALQWARFAGTIMTLPDVAVGGVQALRDVGKLPGEIHEATTLSHAATEAAEAQRLRAEKISNPAKHPAAVQKHLHRANRLATQAQAQAKLAHGASRQLFAARLGIVGSFGATPVGASLMAAMPPDVLLTEAQKRRDQATLAAMVTPEGGMPHDARLDMRVSNISRPSHR
ncbi:hypothetical protein ACSBM8_02905 [Sphingomonas sp. ASY06-1R]|uniref:hypothetical protein n=1 Tax=Sphingomonas sp. ASY06-1R TaxID=3445771 RepID=UPI003FA2F9BF